MHALRLIAYAGFIATMQAGQANASVIVSPVAAVASSTFSSETEIGKTIDQSGLDIPFVSGVTHFDTYVALNPLHYNEFNLEWFTAEGATQAQVTYDLGSMMSVDRLALWNEDFSGFGIARISISDDGIDFSSLTSISPFDNPETPNSYGAEVFALGKQSKGEHATRLSRRFACCVTARGIALRSGGKGTRPASRSRSIRSISVRSRCSASS
jgi:hypothetical protein